jgi:hypothetical protein
MRAPAKEEFAMTSKIQIHLLLLAVAFFGATACQKESSVATQGTVKANQAYLNHFGEPPVPEKGECFARVGFYPLKGSTGKVTAMPFFLFNKDDQLSLLMERLAGNEAGYLSRSQLFNPFPPESSIRLVSQEGETVDLDVSVKESPSAESVAAMAASLTETATQFEGIEKVRIAINGAPLSEMPEGGFAHDAGRIEPPGPPTLLLVIGAWEKGAQDPEEILVDFDRPVEIESFSLLDGAGQEIKGDYFTSAFDMAVVIHPENPSAIREGMTLRAEWRVVDRLGRKGEGAGDFTLERHDHAEGF